MKNVLVVDDTKNIRILLSKCLELKGYKVTTASDGQEALDLFMKIKFDLAFLDIKMPQLSGTEVLKQIRENGVETPVIIITAYATVKNAVECTQMGAVAYLQKPFTPDKIRSVLKELDHTPKQSSQEDNNVEKMITQSKLSLDTGDYVKALEFSKKALSIDLDNREIYLLISKAYTGLENKVNAERYYQIYNLFPK